jgi:hypothetical protein
MEGYFTSGIFYFRVCRHHLYIVWGVKRKKRKEKEGRRKTDSQTQNPKRPLRLHGFFKG